MVEKQRLKITAHSADTIRGLCQSHIDSYLLNEFNVKINQLVDFQLSLIEDSPLPHPVSHQLSNNLTGEIHFEIIYLEKYEFARTGSTLNRITREKYGN